MQKAPVYLIRRGFILAAQMAAPPLLSGEVYGVVRAGRSPGFQIIAAASSRAITQ